MPPTRFGVGQAVTRKEDDPLLRGAGRYVADVGRRACCTPSCCARRMPARAFASPTWRPRARCRACGWCSPATDDRELGPLPCQAGPPDVDLVVPPYPVLARDDVRHVGDAVAFVVADTLDRARDAAEAIVIEWEALPHVIGAVDALARGAAQVWPKRPGNLAFEITLGDARRRARRSQRAARTVSLTLVNQRLVTNYLDTRGVIAEYDAGA